MACTTAITTKPVNVKKSYSIHLCLQKPYESRLKRFICSFNKILKICFTIQDNSWQISSKYFRKLRDCLKM